MKQIIFDSLMTKLDTLIVECKSLYDELSSCHGDVTAWTIEKYLSIRARGQELQAKQDKILSNELYHILGMAKLSVPQQAKFIKATKIFSKYRSAVKRCASLPDLAIKPFDIEGETTFECKELGLTLSGKA